MAASNSFVDDAHPNSVVDDVQPVMAAFNSFVDDLQLVLKDDDDEKPLQDDPPSPKATKRRRTVKRVRRVVEKPPPPSPAPDKSVQVMSWLTKMAEDTRLRARFQRHPDPRMFLDQPLIPIPSQSGRQMRQIAHDWIWRESNRTNYATHRIASFAERLDELDRVTKTPADVSKRVSLKRSADQLRALERMLASRSSRIRLDEANHEYTIDGQRVNQSVTTSLEEICGEFNEDQTIDRMLSSPFRWKKNKHYATCNFDEYGNELTREQKAERLKRKWRESRDDGTRLHKFIENQYVLPSRAAGARDETPGANAYFNFEDIRMFNDWLLVATEYPVYDVASSIAGTIDAIYLPNPLQPRQIVLVDWKRTSITTTVGNMVYEHPLMARYAKGNYWKYAMQLNMYREILERNYGLHVIDAFLVYLPPEQDRCEVMGVPRMLEAKVYLNVLRERQRAAK